MRDEGAEALPTEETGCRTQVATPVLHLLERDVRLLAADDGTPRTNDHGKPTKARNLQCHIAKPSGARLGDAPVAMEAVAATPTRRIPAL
jgi:hypothetical protein